MNLDQLKNRDYALAIDASGSMARGAGNGKTRWATAQETTFALASKIQQFDPDGISVLPFSSSFKRYDNVTADAVEKVFTENEPNGGTALHLVLKDQLDNFFARKASGQLKPNGETIIVVTDGEPDDQKAVQDLIIAATQKMDRDEELAILFAQVGDDPAASAYLKTLDDNLVGKGAKFDIVDTKTFAEIGSMSLSDVLLQAITD